MTIELAVKLIMFIEQRKLRALKLLRPSAPLRDVGRDVITSPPVERPTQKNERFIELLDDADKREGFL